MQPVSSAIKTPVNSSFLTYLFAPVDNSPLVVFRVIFGLLIALEGGGAIATGWVKRVFVDPDYTFTFIGFEWLQPLLGPGMYAIYVTLALAGIMVMLGWYYRLSISIYALLWTTVYLMQKSSYNNHYYLLLLLCWVMVLIPANRYASLDVKFRNVKGSLTCPRWCLLFFVVQISLVYTFAGLAKIYPDWLSLRPINIWFGDKANYPVIGSLLQQEWLKKMVVYGGIGFDLFIAPLLLWQKTRKFAFIIAIAFHLFNSIVFGIGIFPYMMIGFCVFFFPAETIRKIFLKKKPRPETSVSSSQFSLNQNKLVVGILMVYFLFQLFLPLRHLLFKGNVFWTEEGHRMSWRMMLRSKTGTIYFKAKDASTGELIPINTADYLSLKQRVKMASQPDMIWQFSQHLKKKYENENKKIEIYAFAKVSLNGKEPQWLIDTTANLATTKWQPFQHASWILTEE